jgi:glycosyltransferase involved in cell wall biosynthesis
VSLGIVRAMVPTHGSGDSPQAHAPDTSAARPLRVLHIITRMIVGGAQETVMLSCALASPAFKAELLSGVETGPEGDLHGEVEARGVRHHYEPSLVRAVHPWKDLVALFRLWRFIRRGRYDVVHTHSSKAGILGRIAARLAGVPRVVHTVHGWGFVPDQSPVVFQFYVQLERWCAGLCDILAVVADADRDDGLARGIGRPDQYRLVRSGIEIGPYRDCTATRAEARRLLGVPEDAFVVGSVGRLSPQKAPLDLLEGFAMFARERADAHLVLVGDGPLHAEVEARAQALGLSDRIHLAGLRRDIPVLLRAFDIFALASRWEGLPRVFPQAMAAGLPIVATRVAGAAEAVREGENGILVTPVDPGALSAALRALAADPEARRRMGERGRAEVEVFSAERMVRGVEQLYSEGPRKRT